MAEFMPIRVRKIYNVRRESRNVDYRSLYRFEKENVEWIAEHFLGDGEETRGGSLSNLNRMKVFLRYIGDPGFQVGVGEDIGIHRSTVSKTVYFVMAAMLRKTDVWIKFPTSTEDMEIEKAKWQSKYTFPNAIGVIDCTHIPIVKPSVHGDEYLNRKRFTSVNVQATCDALDMFTSVDATWPGSVHDARIWRNSDIYPIMERNTASALLLGDSGYGIAPWLMTPFSPPANQIETEFNRCFTRERVTIERCFGQVKQRFPMLQHKIRIKLEKVPSFILCCFILHNVAKKLNDPDFDLEEQVNRENNQIDGNELVVQGDAALRRQGQLKRTELAGIIHRQHLY